MYGAEDPSIAGMVLDSPFSDLIELMMELADTQSFRLPRFTVSPAIIKCPSFYYAKLEVHEKGFTSSDKVLETCFIIYKYIVQGRVLEFSFGCF